MPRHELTAEFVINTPMFISGADQKQAELRVASIKGAIRFWWRALNYSRFDGDIARMKEVEDGLFGSTTGQSQVLFSLTSPELTCIKIDETLDSARQGLGMRYLGYGLMKSFDSFENRQRIRDGGKLERPCIPSGNFTLRLLSRFPIENCIVDAIKLFGLIGGLGSRSRKGYGSVTLLSIIQKQGIGDSKTLYDAPNNFTEFENRLKQLLPTVDSLKFSNKTEITAFSKDTEIYYLGKMNKATDMLNHYGVMMLRYRSYGRGGQIKDNVDNIAEHIEFNSEKRFEDDHDWYREINGWRGKDTNFHPKRVIFGLPHNYHKKEIHHVEPEIHERRASPLFFHIHKMGSSYIGIALIMKSEFLPNNEKIKAGTRTVDQNINFDLLTAFLTGKKLTEPDKGEAYFPDLQLIYPLEEV